MAEQRHRTVIEIGVDDREVRGLDSTITRAFDDRTLISFERAVERSTRAIELSDVPHRLTTSEISRKIRR